MPVIRGIKTESEKFAGALQTQCIEAMMRDGKALQAGTSHDLGQNFGKAFDVKFQSAEGREEFVWQTSWGVSTRLIGGLIMSHSDDSGLILPPKLAPIQTVIVPIARKPAEKEAVIPVVDKLAADLKARGIAVKVDDREGKRPGEKYYEWERKGVPIRIEVGPRDVASGEAMTKLRVAEDKVKMKIDTLADDMPGVLDGFQKMLLERALKFREENTVTVDTWDDFKDVFANGQSKFAWCHWDGTRETEAKIKEETKVTIRCIPLPGQGPEPEQGKCIRTGKPSSQRVLMAKSY
jgi:prolyl-tRNA synthetase